MSPRPCLWTLPSCLKTLFIDNFNTDDESARQAAFQLIKDAAQRADNIGVDEFPAEWFAMVLHYTDVAIMLYESQEQKHLIGLLIIYPSIFIRSPHPSTCHVVMTADENTRSSPHDRCGVIWSVSGSHWLPNQNAATWTVSSRCLCLVWNTFWP